MSDVRNRSQSSARRSDYVWQYEYYDDEVPVSFEGLRAHRYSIVIGFWVGLAVFVIFMFFVLTLLTKTGAPHQENTDSTEQRHRPGTDAAGTQEESNKAFSHPLLAESGSYFRCYINEEKTRAEDERAGKQDQPGTCGRAAGRSFSGMDGMEEDAEERRPLRESDKESVFFSNFNIPNFVNLEHGSALGEDDLLDEPPGVLESRCQPPPL